MGPGGSFGRICTIWSSNLCVHYVRIYRRIDLLLFGFRVIYVHAERQTTKNLEGKDHDERIHDEKPDGAWKLQHQHHPRGF